MTPGHDPPQRVAPLWKRVFWDLCWVWATTAIIVAAARVFAHDVQLLLIWANSFSLYLYLPAALVLPIAIWRSRRRLAIVSALLLLAQVVWVWPDFLPAQRPPVAENAPGLRVFSANLYTKNTSFEGLLAEITTADADIVLLQEFSSTWHRAVSASGLLEEYPHKELQIREDAFGAAILSKYPFLNTSTSFVGEVPIISVTIQFHALPIQIYNWHPLPPRSQEYVTVWNEQYEDLYQRLSEESGPVLLVGDFNATQHAHWMKRLLRSGYSSAHVQTGRGYAVTFPNGTSRIPPIRLDHALMSNHFWCRRVREGIGRGSDHKPLIVDLLLLRSSAGLLDDSED